MNNRLHYSARILAVTDKDTRLFMAKKYVDNIEIVDSLDAISWFDILLRRVRLIAIPDKGEARNKRELRKRRVIKWLALSISADIARLNFEDCLLGDHGEKVLFVPANSVRLMFEMHLGADFCVLELKDETRAGRMKCISDIAECAGVLGVLDERPGLTVFVNARNDINIRSYKKIHPNKRIVIRYQDRLGYGGLSSRSDEKNKLLEMIVSLRRDGVIDSVESYYKEDAKFLNGVYRPNGVDPEVMQAIDSQERDALYRFIGGPKNLKDRTRLDALSQIRDEIKRIYPYIENWIEERFVLGRKQWEPYELYLRDMVKSEVVIDLCRISQEEGLSYRIPEALFLNRKIITNRLIVRDEPFYSSDRVFLIGVDDISRLKEFLEKDIEPLPRSILKFYDSCLWWSSIDPVGMASN